MTTANSNLQFDSSSDANFRAWGSGIAALLTTGGFWTKAGDSGQINWSTVTSPAASGIAGFEIYVSNDALSTSFPIYMKISYGNNSAASPKAPQIQISFGSGSNGSGTLTGNVSSTYSFTAGNQVGTGATTYACYASGGAGYFTMLLWLGSDNFKPIAVVVERSLDATGVYTNSYMTWFLLGYALKSQRSMLRPAAGGFTTEASVAVTVAWAGTGIFGSFAAVFPMFPFVGYFDNCMMAALGMNTSDQSELAGFDVTLYGTSHHYLYSKSGSPLTGAFGSAIGIGIRYE